MNFMNVHCHFQADVEAEMGKLAVNQENQSMTKFTQMMKMIMTKIINTND